MYTTPPKDPRVILEFTNAKDKSLSWYVGYQPNGGPPIFTSARYEAFIFPSAWHAGNVLGMDVRFQGGKVVPYA